MASINEQLSNTGAQGQLYEVLAEVSLADVGEVLALRAQMEQQQRIAKWKQELATTNQRLEELKARRRELEGLEEGSSNGSQTSTT